MLSPDSSTTHSDHTVATSNYLTLDPASPSPVLDNGSIPKDYFRFVSAQGLRIVEDKTCLWVEKRSRFWESAPSHRRVVLSHAVSRKLFALGALAIRYTCPDDRGTETCEYIWDDKNYGPQSLHKNSRYSVRKNLDLCIFRPIDFDLLIREGCTINQNVYERQDRKSDFQTDPLQWKRYMETCAGLPFVEAYGVFIQDRLCAYSLALFVDDYCYTFHPYAHSNYLKFYPMNVLIFSLVQRILQRPGVRCISYGVESYTSRPTLERFKIAMGCRKSSLRRQIVVHPLFRPAFTNSGAWLTERALKLFMPSLAEDFSIFSRVVRGISASENLEQVESEQ
jgi:hypothetical protein